MVHRSRRLAAFLVTASVLAVAALANLGAAPRDDAKDSNLSQATLRWWKGNLHTHSLWSDGDDFPEMIIDWYKQNGYHFLALSDHNILSEGQKWIDPSKSRGGIEAFKKYRERFGDSWVEQREVDGTRLVRLKPLSEFRAVFDEPNRFLLIQSEEITDSFRELPVHVNATNLRDLIPPQGGESVLEVMQNNVDAVLEQREKTGRPMVPHINHPNFYWAITAEDIARLRGERFFEVYNGHPSVRNCGDELHAGMERMWDIILTQRLVELGEPVMYAVAVDDAHNYHEYKTSESNPGRGWIVVRSARLTPESIVAAMEAGRFYASTGVRLRDVAVDSTEIRLEIEPEPGVTFTTYFVGTLKGYDRRTEPVVDEQGNPLPVTRRYSDDVGQVLAEVKGTAPSYVLTGEEIYVRAKVVSSKKKENPYAKNELEVAWTQPVVLGADAR